MVPSNYLSTMLFCIAGLAYGYGIFLAMNAQLNSYFYTRTDFRDIIINGLFWPAWFVYLIISGGWRYL